MENRLVGVKGEGEGAGVGTGSLGFAEANDDI